jgi:hypothetical protein
VPVRSALLRGRIGAGAGPLAAADVRIDPESVSIAGPRRVVVNMRFVKTTADTISPSDTLPHLVDIDTTGIGVQVRPPQVKAMLRHPIKVPPARRLPLPSPP